MSFFGRVYREKTQGENNEYLCSADIAGLPRFQYYNIAYNNNSSHQSHMQASAVPHQPSFRPTAVMSRKSRYLLRQLHLRCQLLPSNQTDIYFFIYSNTAIRNVRSTYLLHCCPPLVRVCCVLSNTEAWESYSRSIRHTITIISRMLRDFTVNSYHESKREQARREIFISMSTSTVFSWHILYPLRVNFCLFVHLLVL